MSNVDMEPFDGNRIRPRVHRQGGIRLSRVGKQPGLRHTS